MNEPLREVDQCRWIPAKNISSEDIPPYAVVRLRCYADGQTTIDKPDRSSYPFGLAANGPVTIKAGGSGQVSKDWPLFVLVSDDSDSGSGYGSGSGPAHLAECGEIWGPKAGSWALHEDETGFWMGGSHPENNDYVYAELYPDFAREDEYIDLDITDCVYAKLTDNTPDAAMATAFGEKTPVVDTGDETDLGVSFTTTSDLIDDGTTISVKVSGLLTTSGSPPTLQLLLKAGVTTIIDTGAMTLPGPYTNARWVFEADLTSWDSLSFDVQGEFRFLYDPDHTRTVGLPGTDTISLGRSVDVVLTMKAIWGSPDPDSSIVVRQGKSETRKPTS